jgi:hypothetical protein
VPGQMDRAGKGSTTSSSKTATTSASSKSTAIKKTADGFTYLDPAQFHEYFAADLPAEQAAFMSRSQVLNAAGNFNAVNLTESHLRNLKLADRRRRARLRMN